jgi:hypothetical protein
MVTPCSWPPPTAPRPTAARCGSRAWPRPSWVPDGRAVARVAPTRARPAAVQPGQVQRYIDTALRDPAAPAPTAWSSVASRWTRCRCAPRRHLPRCTQADHRLAGDLPHGLRLRPDDRAGRHRPPAPPATPFRAIWEALYGIKGPRCTRQEALIPGTTTPDALPRFRADGRIDPRRDREATPLERSALYRRSTAAPPGGGWTGCCWARSAPSWSSAACWSGRPPSAATTSSATTGPPICASRSSTSRLARCWAASCWPPTTAGCGSGRRCSTSARWPGWL